ncbi:SDR family NAD(P)-dependent oxidoreductase [Chloroflexota bacterium]
MTEENCMRLVGKVAVVTGAGQWIGRAIALRLAGEGADVVVDDIVIERAREVADEIRGLGRKALAVQTDVTRSQETDAMAKAALAEFGKIDILVNNVGGTGGRKAADFVELTEEAWDDIIARNLKSTRNCCHAVINQMLERKSGKIVNISSGAGVRGNPGSTAYSAAKAGVIGFTMALSEEVATSGVRVNCVSPGPTGSAAPRPPEFMEKMAQLSGLGRQGKPEDVAALVAFLASDDADFISGQNYVMAAARP